MKTSKTLSDRLPALGVLAFCLLGAGLLGWKFFGGPGNPNVVDVTMPPLSDIASAGKQVFDANCAACHGDKANGTDKGPPLVHNIYNPGHHADGSFLMAAKRGVRAHHWPFGNMPAQPQVKDQEIPLIIRYVRELQVANGIVYQPHKM
ncbi:MAG: cytochrome c [Alphaproteobacteria bacterium]|jgi:mono/diheme cytochrome c family protein|nr:cytochrome c [Alphaproteobacteria bacterium]MBT4083151.1 cytochrome c [Alphaproteobacteria bacterium]MBT4544560.1 cytochrome c [Alphaproteobacteria bacterium]MBT7746754.1 cytochrome c [Alphaproteobacteria bacterium]